MALLALLVVPTLTRTAEPPVNRQELGILESILNYCGPVDADAAAKLHQKIDRMLQGVDDAALGRARASKEYRHAYESVTAFVAKVDEHNAKRVCSEPLDPGNSDGR